MRWISLYILVSLWTVGPLAWGGPYLDKCNSKSDEDKGKCDAVVQKLKEAEAKIVASGQALSGEQINVNSSISGTAISGQAANLAQAVGACQALQTECETECDSQKAKALGVPQDPPSYTNYNQAQSDAKQIPGAKQNKCTQPIQQDIQQMKAGAAPLPDQKNQADKTGQNSGMPPIQMPSGGSPSDSSTPTPTSTSQNCTTYNPDGSCSAATTTATFTPATGGTLSSTQPTNSTAAGTKSTSLSPQSTTTDASASAVRDSTGNAASTSGSTTGSSGSTGMQPSSVAATGTKPDSSPREGTTTGPGSLAPESMGGGGGSYNGNSSNDNSSSSSLELPNWGLGKEKPLIPAQPVAGSGSTDQSAQHGPSLFYISDMAISSFCAKNGVHKTCAANK